MTIDEAQAGDVVSEGKQPGKRRGLRKALWIGGPLVLLAGAYVGVAAWQSGKIPDGTSVGGVSVGGLDRADAGVKLRASTKAQLAEPIDITAAGRDLSINPATSGISIDTSSALDGLTGFSLKPSTVWQHLAGGGPRRELPVKFNQQALQHAVAQAGAVIKGSPVNGSVKYIGGKVVTKESTPGRGIDAAAVATHISQGWPGKTSYVADLSEQPAPLTDGEIDRYVSAVANPAMSAPIKVAVGDKSASLQPAEVSNVLSTDFDGKTLQTKVDETALTELLDSKTAGLVTAPVNAKLSVKDGQTSVIPGKDGTVVETGNAGKQLIEALTAADRTMSLPTKVAKPQVSEADLKKVTIGNELMSEFVSPFPTGASNAARTENIRVGLARLNGIVVAPGETFSLLDTLRPFTKANGYVDAPTLQGGIDVPGMGGGISQVSTTLYNATFFAGLKLVEHTAHTYWIPRYPMGREATMWDPTIDNKWTNDSGHPVRIEAGIEGDAAVIRLYGTKVFSVTSSTSDQFAFVQPGKAKHLTGDKCIAQPPQEGFKVTVTRVVKDRAGKVVKDESVTTKYEPAVRVTCN
ncbi:VanW family protein [Flexivirga meconopsidis]|uniref:VanW family protein n=1 Tax=Flexivirga meconopsidis TaxID=2977121 RepID=UPI00223EB0CA|nr:VanW family protein [Flexivirga meconopsidis]